MSLETLSARTIADLGGGEAEIIIDRAIQKAIADFDDRAEEDGKPRRVSIDLTIEQTEHGPAVHVTAAAKLPPSVTRKTLGSLKHATGRQVGFAFQPHCPDNPDQNPLPGIDEGRSA